MNKLTINLKLFFTIKDQLTAVRNNIGQSKQTTLEFIMATGNSKWKH